MLMATEKLNMKTAHIYEMYWDQAAQLPDINYYFSMAQIDRCSNRTLDFRLKEYMKEFGSGQS